MNTEYQIHAWFGMAVGWFGAAIVYPSRTIAALTGMFFLAGALIFLAYEAGRRHPQ